jgi:hypothetical protein
VLVLAAGHGVQVDDAVDAVLGAQSHDRVEALEARLEQLEGTVIALEVAVVHRDPHAVDAEAGEETRVAVLEEARQHAVEEASGAQRSEHRGHGGPHLALRGRIAGDEVLHVHPAAEAHAAQHDARALGIDDPVAVDAQQALGPKVSHRASPRFRARHARRAEPSPSRLPSNSGCSSATKLETSPKPL